MLFYYSNGLRFFGWYIYNASASKRIIANQLECNICQPLKFHFFIIWELCQKMVCYVTSRDTQFILVHDNRTPIGTSLPIMGELRYFPTRELF